MSNTERRLEIQKKSFVQNKWSESEVKQLKELVKIHTEPEIAAMMHRTPGSIRGQKERLGLKSASGWLEQEIIQLKTLVSKGKSNSEIAQIMGRTRSAIRQERYKLGLGEYSVRKWTAAEVAELRELAKEYTTAELAEHFNREWTAVERKCKSLGIKTQSKQITIIGDFTDEDDAFIIRSAQFLRNAEIAEKLGRTEGSIKAHKTRLRKKGIVVPSYERGKVRPTSIDSEDEENQKWLSKL